MSEELIEIPVVGECTIYEVAEWQQKIITLWPDEQQSVCFNLSQVNEMDASFVQLLLGCKKAALSQGVQCVISEIPPSVEERFQQMNVADLLMQNDNLGETSNG